MNMRVYRKARFGKCPLFRRVSVLLCFCLVSQIFLTGCGGGGGGGGGGGPAAVPPSGTVNKSVNVSNELAPGSAPGSTRVLSVYAPDPVAVDSNGIAQVPVAIDGVQLLAAVSDNGTPCGLALADTTSSGAVDLNANSTAVALVLLSVSILAEPSATTRPVLQQIEQLPEVQTLADALREDARTGHGSLNSPSDEVMSAIEAAQSAASAIFGTRGVDVSPAGPQSGITVTAKASRTVADAAEIDAYHFEIRPVALCVTSTFVDDHSGPDVLSGVIEPTPSATWGNIITGRMGDAMWAPHIIYQWQPSELYVTLKAIGPGRYIQGELTSSEEQIWNGVAVQAFIFQIVIPFTALIAGCSTVGKKVAGTSYAKLSPCLKTALSKVKDANKLISLAKSLNSTGSSDPREQRAGFYDALFTLLGILATSGVIASILEACGVAAASIAAVAAALGPAVLAVSLFLGVVSAGFAAANLYKYVHDAQSWRQIEKWRIQRDSGTIPVLIE